MIMKLRKINQISEDTKKSLFIAKIRMNEPQGFDKEKPSLLKKILAASIKENGFNENQTSDFLKLPYDAIKQLFGSFLLEEKKKHLHLVAELKIPLDIDEAIGISLYDEGKKASKFYNVKRLKLEEVSKSIDAETSYLGSVIGYPYEWTKGAKEPFIKIRDVASNQLIKCSYDNKDYRMVAKLFEKQDALVIVTGRINYNKLTDEMEIISATDFEIAPSLSHEQYEGFFGCAQGLTGGVDVAEYIRNIRDNE